MGIGVNEDELAVSVEKSPVKAGIPEKSASIQSDYLSNGAKRLDEMSLHTQRKIIIHMKEERVPVSVGIVTVLLFILAGAVLFAVWEGWNVFDGAYFSFITLTTIGFGDMVPGKFLDSGSEEKLIICSLYLLVGMALIAMCFKLMQDDVVKKTRWLGEKIGLLVQQEPYDDEESDGQYQEERFSVEDTEEISNVRPTFSISSGDTKVV
ncbi:unnamed protein product [Soboliphyme baturini]|uniref:Ion_trans_2 domain-containing protein n=1 Tax=Soboliphyme baturini TaxID=241478 RepID=A0A183I9R1_9BILA|nr:unnamed protein product [Soboliphyme baturini]